MNAHYYLRIGGLHIPFSRRLLATAALLAAALAIVAVVALWQGTTAIAAADLLRWLSSPGAAADHQLNAIMQLRLPRIAVAILGGAMVAASGYLLQVVSGNGLADPGIIGISQGASASILLGAVSFGIPADWLALTGLVGGLLTGVLVLALAFHLNAANGLILIGLAVSVTLGAVIEIVMVSGGITQFARYLTWSHGSLAAVSADDAARLGQWALALCLPLLYAPRLMAPLRLGSDQAAGIGASPQWFRPALILLATALVAPVVAIAGPVSFVGLIAAHIARRMVTDRCGEILPVAMLIGALLMLLADLAGRTLFLPLIIPAGLMVSLAGVIGFLIVARARRK